MRRRIRGACEPLVKDLSGIDRESSGATRRSEAGGKRLNHGLGEGVRGVVHRAMPNTLDEIDALPQLPKRMHVRGDTISLRKGTGGGPPAPPCQSGRCYFFPAFFGFAGFLAMTAHTPYRRRSATAERSIVSSSGEVKRSRRDIGYPTLHSTTPFPSGETACLSPSSGRHSWRMSALPVWVQLSPRLSQVPPSSGGAVVLCSCRAPRRAEERRRGRLTAPSLHPVAYFFAGFFGSLGFFVPPQPPHTVLTPLLRRGFLRREEKRKPSLPRKSRPARSPLLDSASCRGAVWVTVRFSAVSEKGAGDALLHVPRTLHLLLPLLVRLGWLLCHLAHPLHRGYPTAVAPSVEIDP